MLQSVINDSTLTEIADAINAKAGTTGKMLPSAMAAKIASIPSGGEFYWTKQPWLNDRYTHAWIKITPEMADREFGVCFQYIAQNGATIDWGDGTSEAIAPKTELTGIYRKHAYSADGVYRIDIRGYDSMDDSKNTPFVWSRYGYADQGIRDKLVQVEFGHHFLYGYSDGGMYGTLNYCRNLHYAKFDQSRPSGSFGSFCHMCQSLKEVILPSADGITLGNFNCFRGTQIEELTIPNGFLLGNQPLAYADRLKKVVFEEGTTVVNPIGNCLRMAFALEEIEFPSTLTEIAGTYMLYNAGIAMGVDGLIVRLKSQVPPILNNKNNFTETVVGKYIVPKGCADSYKAATNWSTFAAKIVEED